MDETRWTAAEGSFDKRGIDTVTLSDAHEYKLTVYWNETLPNGKDKEWRKSKNFFVQAEEEQGGTGGVSAGSGVAGATASGSVRGQSGGSLAAVGSAATRSLPFTGLPILIPLLAGAALLTAGLLLRRHARATR